MKSLLLLRHAKSSWKDPSLADHERPLNNRGKRAAPIMGNLLMQENLVPDYILCSTAKRARETVKRLLTTCDFQGNIEHHRDLYHSDYITYLGLLQGLPDEINIAMIVGHNPEMNHFLDVICDAYEHMPTAAIAYIQFSIHAWANLSDDFHGKLVQFWKPRDLE